MGKLVILIMGIAFAVWLFSGKFSPPKDPAIAAAERAQRDAKAADDKRKGFHCLSPWDGSHSAMKGLVKDRMRDPASFEHIETKITPVDTSLKHTVIMRYRARNGFGGMNVGAAFGTVDHSSCAVTVTSIE